jgi:hypothetical protein
VAAALVAFGDCVAADFSGLLGGAFASDPALTDKLDCDAAAEVGSEVLGAAVAEGVAASAAAGGDDCDAGC